MVSTVVSNVSLISVIPLFLQTQVAMSTRYISSRSSTVSTTIPANEPQVSLPPPKPNERHPKPAKTPIRIKNRHERASSSLQSKRRHLQPPPPHARNPPTPPWHTPIGPCKRPPQWAGVWMHGSGRTGKNRNKLALILLCVHAVRRSAFSTTSRVYSRVKYCDTLVKTEWVLIGRHAGLGFPVVGTRGWRFYQESV